MQFAAKDLLTVKAFARALSRHENTVYAMLHRGDVETVRVGGRYMIPKAEVERVQQPQGSTPAGGDPDRLMQLWFQACGTDEPRVVLTWLAQASIDFQARYPALAAAESRALYHRNTAAHLVAKWAVVLCGLFEVLRHLL